MAEKAQDQKKRREYLDKQEVIALLRKWAKDAWANEWKPTHDNIRGDTFMEASLIVEDMLPVRVEEINNIEQEG